MLTQAVENLLNRGLPQSPRARELCAELTGRRLAIAIRGVARVLVESSGDALALRHENGAPAPVEAEVRGGPLSLMALAGADAQAVIQRGEVVIAGDTELAQKYRELALLLQPDIEEELSRLVGDATAHQLGRFARLALAWGRRAADTTVRNAAEYLAHERADLVPRAEADQFLRGVDRLRETVDRLEARILRLERRE
ncbi:MAG TPA: SCP2 sterol-binding domain-containing protein [Steroidobacteraceae bacterium]|nr:SCP2 sterol-binding domain-containing protein [Steroidobacteraceae bacterium]